MEYKFIISISIPVYDGGGRKSAYKNEYPVSASFPSIGLVSVVFAGMG
jgi:hypothetical protein